MGPTKPSSVESGEDNKDPDSKPSPSRVEEGSTEDVEDRFAGYVVDREMEKKMLRKFDLIILPTLALMYLMKYTILSGKASAPRRRLTFA